MKTHWTREDFDRAVIAQDDDNDYDESGYVVAVDGTDAGIASYSHCSCFGTFESLCGGGISDSYDKGDITWTWFGSVAELVRLAANGLDPNMPERAVNPADYDADHLLKCYEQVLAWHAKRTGDPVAAALLADGSETALAILRDRIEDMR